jgi:hypothetical protein
MKAGQCRLYVRPQYSGAYTRWRLSGSLATTVPTTELRPLFRTLSFWSGWPVELVLPADAGMDDWFTWWSETIAQIPERHLHIRFMLPPLAARLASHEH